ncbi:GNAT family N-acetyltransferase [Mesorhizobium sp. CAU 1741]|uniref:GNAT family N-acetyltransferase n=1 Tax=Mesorhizobium sp. CAU 1741 TaxID=3140366 RepID=UPI00325B3736
MTAMLIEIGSDDQDIVAGLAVDPLSEAYAGGSIGDVFDRLRASPPLQTPFALYDEDKVVGFIVLREADALPDWAVQGCITLSNLRIDKQCQGRGYGKLAIRLAARWIMANRPQVTTIMSSVNMANDAALALNAACGFTATGRIVQGLIGRQTILSSPVERLRHEQSAPKSK